MRKDTDSCPVAVPRHSRGRQRIPMRVRLLAARHSLATDCGALVGVGSSAGVRNGVRRIFRVPQRASPMPSR